MSLTFSVDSLLLSELGERLVSKNYIALAELIKNAYDADATKVTVVFQNIEKAPGPSSQIILIDDGHGMTFDQVKSFWMKVATPNKLRNPFSPKYGRPKTGDKGIGRFACRRLAKRLILESTAECGQKGKREFTKVLFEWKKFKAGLTLTDIPNEYEKKMISTDATGLTIRLVGLSEPWSTRDLNVLRRQVLGLSLATGAKRKGFNPDPGFEVILEAPEFKSVTGKISEQVMNAGWGRLKGSVSANGTASESRSDEHWQGSF